jgi:2-haloacid dehalogenase
MNRRGSGAALIAFDIYGTVIDTAGIAAALGAAFAAQAQQAAQLWRERQLEFTFRRALMRHYVDFDQCTREALASVAAQLRVPLSAAEEARLLECYRSLPAFPDARAALETLRRAGLKLVALTNGTERSVRQLLEHAGLGHCFELLLSADAIRTFKPDPAVYALLEGARPPAGADAWLVSGNPFDVIGARACGLRTVWVRRDPARVFDPWEFHPDVIVASLAELAAALPRRVAG